jgi:hypothetical protein
LLHPRTQWTHPYSGRLYYLEIAEGSWPTRLNEHGQTIVPFEIKCRHCLEYHALFAPNRERAEANNESNRHRCQKRVKAAAEAAAKAAAKAAAAAAMITE